jgi:hypothetical protein
MLIERMTFRAKYGKGDALLEVIRDFSRQFGDLVARPVRLATDRTGTMFTVTWDIEYDDTEDWVAGDKKERALFGTPEFAAWFATMEPLVDSASRDLFETVEL